MVRLKGNLPSFTINIIFRFQFLMVRLKVDIWYNKDAETLISIPYGAIKSQLNYHNFVAKAISIPYGAIKRYI